MKPIKTILLIVLTVFFLFSCASSIPITTTKPPQANYKGAKVVGVLPTSFAGENVLGELRRGTYFRWYERQELNDELKMARYTTAKLEELMTGAGYFSVISSSQLGADSSGKTIPDVYILATLSPFTEDTDSESYVKENDDGDDETYYEYTRYSRVEIVFQVINSATYEIYDSFSVMGDAESVSTNYNKLPQYSALRTQAINKALEYAKPKLVPITSTTYVYMKKLETKDKELIKKLNDLVSNKFYQDAYDAYMDHFRSSGDKAAEYNAILLLEPLDKLDEAIQRMEAYARETGDKDAVRALQRMKQNKADREAL